MSGYLVQLASARCRGGVLTARLLLPFVKPGLTKQLTSPYKKIKNVTGQSAFHRRFECHHVTLQKVRRRIQFAFRHQTYETEYAHPQTEKRKKKKKRRETDYRISEFQTDLICTGHQLERTI